MLKLVSLFFLFTVTLNGQSYYDIAKAKTGQLSFVKSPVAGLWIVERVQVGEDDRTPTAKWFDFQENGEFVGGNGGVTNLRGAWAYDQDNKQLIQQISTQADPYGAFDVIFSADGSSMTWRRLEDGRPVAISLKKTNSKPLAPWDLIQGSWKNEKAEGLELETKEVKSIYQMELNSYYFGWDRTYRKFDKEGTLIETGLWHIEAHAPQLWTINDTGNTKVAWTLDVQEETMTWTREGEMELLKVYFERVHE
mgnify:CR=1 FL=1